MIAILNQKVRLKKFLNERDRNFRDYKKLTTSPSRQWTIGLSPNKAQAMETGCTGSSASARAWLEKSGKKAKATYRIRTTAGKN